VEKLATL